jgi:uncharacterized protein YjiS (DUF1127 family)
MPSDSGKQKNDQSDRKNFPPARHAPARLFIDPREDHRIAAPGSGQTDPALAAVPSLTGTQIPASLQEAGAGLVRRLFDVVRNSRMRLRERRVPLELDDHVLRDIGLTRVEYRFLPMSRATTDPDRSQNSRNLHDGPPPSLYVSSVARIRQT